MRGTQEGAAMLLSCFAAAGWAPCTACPSYGEMWRGPLLVTEATRDVTAAAAACGTLATVAARAAAACALWRAAVAAAATDALDGERSLANCFQR